MKQRKEKRFPSKAYGAEPATPLIEDKNRQVRYVRYLLAKRVRLEAVHRQQFSKKFFRTGFKD